MMDDLEFSLQELINNKNNLPERARKDLETHIVEYRKLIAKMAHKYVRNRVEHDDLAQEAMIGLILADRDFNPERSKDFHTYAITRVKGKMYEYCIANESPIYVPTHIAKASSYIKQMQRLLDKEPYLQNQEVDLQDIVCTEVHTIEKELPTSCQEALKELKRKLGRIAYNSKMSYEKLSGLALKSLSMIVSDEVLVKFPKETQDVEDAIMGSEIKNQIKILIGDKRLTVLEMRLQGWTHREIAEKLYRMGHRNKSGGVISRQAVKSILDDTIKMIKKSKVYKSILSEEEMEEED